MEIAVADIAMVLGWLGAGGSMGAYYLVSSGRFAPDSLRYHALNMSACILLAIACCATASWPSMVTNLLFVAIGVRMTWRVRDRLWVRIEQVFRYGARPRKIEERSDEPADVQSINCSHTEPQYA